MRTVTELDVVDEVAEHPGGEVRTWIGSTPPDAPSVLLIDTGYKENIARCLLERGIRVMIAPYTIDLDQIRRLSPDGIVLANGPGDPESLSQLTRVVGALIREPHPIPLFGICLGHQIIGLAAGAQTSRLPFGHHGGNHPVREQRTGRVTITSQNHNFQVDAASLPVESGFYVSHTNLSDGSVEGLAHKQLPIFSVQYHPEAAPGPEDNRLLFDRFAGLIRAQPTATSPDSPHQEEMPSRAAT